MSRALLAAVALGALVVACGDGGGDGVASLEEGDTTTSLPDRTDTEASLLAFAQCVREQGIDLPDPGVGPDGGFEFIGGLDEEIDPDALLEARDACSQHLEGLTLEQFGLDQTDIEDRLYEYAACMRENGYDLPDPDLQGFVDRILGPGRQNPQGADDFNPFGIAIDPTDPDFLAADEVCRSIFIDLGVQTEGGPFDQRPES